MSDNIQKLIFTKNLNHYISLSGKSQKEIADSIGVSPQTFNTWCQGIAIPRMGKIQLLSDYFNISKSDLIEEHAYNNARNTINAVTIPVLRHVASDTIINTATEIVDTEEITEDMAKTGDFFALQIKGDSMEPRMIEGDIVIVKKQEDADSGDIVIASVDGYEAACKRLVKYATSMALVSLNSKYEPIVFTQEEIQSKSVRIIGKVVELRGKF